MAKKKASSGMNMAEEIRNLLTDKPDMSGREVIEALKAKFPGEKINTGSAGVAFSNARKKLGLSTSTGTRKSGAKVVKKKLPSAPAATRRPSIDLATLQAAAKFVSQVGDVDAALEAVRQVVALQITK